jgi:hypothetical protein
MICLLCVLLLAGCAELMSITKAQSVNTYELTIQIGKTTKADLTHKLGAPQSLSTIGSSEMWGYTFGTIGIYSSMEGLPGIGKITIIQRDGTQLFYTLGEKKPGLLHLTISNGKVDSYNINNI